MLLRQFKFGDEPHLLEVFYSAIHEVACRDYKIAADPPRFPQGRALGDGVERLVHDLRGIRIGIAVVAINVLADGLSTKGAKREARYL